MQIIPGIYKDGKIELQAPACEGIESSQVHVVILPKQQSQKEQLKSHASALAKTFYEIVHKPQIDKEFIPGVSNIGYGGRVFDHEELVNLLDSSLDFWLTAGSYADRFEREFAAKLGVGHCSIVNSGSSANLVALAALTSPKLKERRINKGDEVIAVAAGFPTTVNPILQLGAVPVFVDVTLPTYNIDVSMLEAARSERTKAVMVAHTLGNPFDIDAVLAFCRKYNLWLIEDNCDSLGSVYKGKPTGSFGDIATSSFYPPHHITMGEGGAVYTSSTQLKILIESFRDWGRDCHCPPGKDNTCLHRFDMQLGSLPKGYDHKYIYSHLGYNLKVTDMQAAIGCAQLKKLDRFVEARRKNWQIFRDGLSDMGEFFVLPEANENSQPSWFGFLLTIRNYAGFTRNDIVEHLESKKIQTRMLFAGNYVRHPVFDEYKKQNAGFRVVGDLRNSDLIMNNSFWLGVYPGLRPGMLDYIIEEIRKFVKR